MGTTPPITTNNPQNTRPTKPDQTSGTKLSQHEPHGPTSGRKLSLFTRNGSIWRFFYVQGEFCPVLTTKKLSRENFVPNTRQSCGSPTGHQAPPAWRAPEGPVWRVSEGPVWRARAGFEAQSLGSAGGRWRGLYTVPVGGGRTRPRQISHVISDGHFLRPPKNVAIPTR